MSRFVGQKNRKVNADKTMKNRNVSTDRTMKIGMLTREIGMLARTEP